MYAIIQTGGKQYHVKKGDLIDVDLLESAEGEDVEFKEVLFVNDGKSPKVGAPFLSDYVVVGELVNPLVKGEKVVSYKFRRRKNSQTKQGHRQKYARVKIKEIQQAKG